MASQAPPSWKTYRSSIGDRSPLFAAIADRWHPRSALYPGSYLDLSVSTAIPRVAYVDMDRRAARFFADRDLMQSELANRIKYQESPEIEFYHRDYREPLPCANGSFDLLISLYAGPVWDTCRQYLSMGGLLLANTSHGDASLAALDTELQLIAVVHQASERYRVSTRQLDSYLIPRRPEKVNADDIRSSGRGIGYTRTAFAYIFRFLGPDQSG